MSQLIEQGGWVFGGIALLSLGASGLIGWKWLQIRSHSARSFAWADDAVRRVRAGDHTGALAVAREHPDLVGRFVSTGLESADPRRFFMPRHLDPFLRGESADLRRHLGLIAVLGSLAPLLGLLGTILGMVQTFSAITLHGTRDAGLIADGVSQALVTTQAGLVTALPILVLHGWLVSRARRCVETARLYGKKIETALCHG